MNNHNWEGRAVRRPDRTGIPSLPPALPPSLPFLSHMHIYKHGKYKKGIGGREGGQAGLAHTQRTRTKPINLIEIIIAIIIF